jgi:hypothetical protein
VQKLLSRRLKHAGGQNQKSKRNIHH